MQWLHYAEIERQKSAGKCHRAIKHFFPKMNKFPIPIPAQTDRATHVTQKWPKFARNSKVTPWISTRNKSQSNQLKSKIVPRGDERNTFVWPKRSLFMLLQEI